MASIWLSTDRKFESQRRSRTKRNNNIIIKRLIELQLHSYSDRFIVAKRDFYFTVRQSNDIIIMMELFSVLLPTPFQYIQDMEMAPSTIKAVFFSLALNFE